MPSLFHPHRHSHPHSHRFRGDDTTEARLQRKLSAELPLRVGKWEQPRWCHRSTRRHSIGASEGDGVVVVVVLALVGVVASAGGAGRGK